MDFEMTACCVCRAGIRFGLVRLVHSLCSDAPDGIVNEMDVEHEGTRGNTRNEHERIENKLIS